MKPVLSLSLTMAAVLMVSACGQRSKNDVPHVQWLTHPAQQAVVGLPAQDPGKQNRLPELYQVRISGRVIAADAEVLQKLGLPLFGDPVVLEAADTQRIWQALDVSQNIWLVQHPEIWMWERQIGHCSFAHQYEFIRDYDLTHEIPQPMTALLTFGDYLEASADVREGSCALQAITAESVLLQEAKALRASFMINGKRENFRWEEPTLLRRTATFKPDEPFILRRDQMLAIPYRYRVEHIVANVRNFSRDVREDSIGLNAKLHRSDRGRSRISDTRQVLLVHAEPIDIAPPDSAGNSAGAALRIKAMLDQEITCDLDSADLATVLAAIRKLTPMPIALSDGVRLGEHAERINIHAHGEALGHVLQQVLEQSDLFSEMRGEILTFVHGSEVRDMPAPGFGLRDVDPAQAL
jgi:hypothetical protein